MGHAPALRNPRPLAAIVVSLVTLMLAGCGINTIPTYEQNAKAAWSEVLNQYKRRADLIPNLVETVKGFADQEKHGADRRRRGAGQGDTGANQCTA